MAPVFTTSVPAAPIVAYYVTINTPTPTANQIANTEAAIAAVGGTAVQLNAANIATFDFSSVSMVYTAAYDSPFIVQRHADLENWVRGGGVVLIDDAALLAGYNFTGSSSYPTNGGGGADIDFVAPANTLISHGPAGLLTNTSLDGGGSSFHFTIAPANLPPGAQRIMQAGTDATRVVGFSYRLDLGFVYYSSIPMAFYLDNLGNAPFSTNAKTVYLPNLLAYGIAQVPEPQAALLLAFGLATAAAGRSTRIRCRCRGT